MKLAISILKLTFCTYSQTSYAHFFSQVFTNLLVTVIVWGLSSAQSVLSLPCNVLAVFPGMSLQHKLNLGTIPWEHQHKL